MPRPARADSRWSSPSTSTCCPGSPASGRTWNASAEASEGGIGTTGPGETQIETDRRIVRTRIARIKKDLDAVRRHRSQYRSRRRSGQTPVVSLVGYTNAGKSTLLNSLAGAGVAAEDRLFSTLDPVTRKVRLPSGGLVLMTDTVGFIQKLPHAVVSAFRATLEEAQESAMLIHVVDFTHANAAGQAQVVEGILGDLGLLDKPRILALNKTDLLDGSDPEAQPGWSAAGPVLDVPSPERQSPAIPESRPVVPAKSLPRTGYGAGIHPDLQGRALSGAVLTSALTGRGLDNLLSEIEAQVNIMTGQPIAGAPAVQAVSA